MNLADIVNRNLPPEPWSEGDNIPWNEPDFSRRMLAEHLSQEHGLASRQTKVIDQQVDWIENHVIEIPEASVLDLGCGPGLYAHRFASRGHRVTGIDFSPASIEHARGEALSRNLPIDYKLGDIRETDFGCDHHMAMLIFGEFNVFSTPHARAILDKVAGSLRERGRLLLEFSSAESLAANASGSPRWGSFDGGLFSDSAYLQLVETFWDAQLEAATHRYFIVGIPDMTVDRYAVSYQGYSELQVTRLLTDAGFSNIQFHPWLAVPTPSLDFTVVAERIG